MPPHPQPARLTSARRRLTRSLEAVRSRREGGTATIDLGGALLGAAEIVTRLQVAPHSDGRRELLRGPRSLGLRGAGRPDEVCRHRRRSFDPEGSLGKVAEVDRKGGGHVLSYVRRRVRAADAARK